MPASTLATSVPVMRPTDSAANALESTPCRSCAGVNAEIGGSGFFTYSCAFVGSCFHGGAPCGDGLRSRHRFPFAGCRSCDLTIVVALEIRVSSRGAARCFSAGQSGRLPVAFG